MKKKITIITTLLVLVCSLAVVFASIEYWDEIEWEYGNNEMTKSTNLAFTNVGIGWNLIGVVSSGDTVDWYRFEPDETGIGTFELQLTDTGIDADISVYTQSGGYMYSGYPSGTSKIISNFYMPMGSTYYFKVEYKSGAPAKPYELKAKLEAATFAKLQKVTNINDVPKALLENK